MLNLEELVFKVNTKELVDAVTDLKNLSQAVTDLGTKSAGINVKVNKTTAEVKSQAKAVKEATEETNKSATALQRQQDILNFMTQGFSKGQSSVLAYAKAAGAATSEITELGKVLDRQRTLMGTDPFDKSIGAMKALRNEYTVLREVNRLYNADLNLSKNQMNELAREKLRLIEKLKIEGKSFTDVKNALRDLKTAYIQNANAENTLDANMRRRQKAIQDTAKANEYLAKEMDRVNRMLGNTDNITSTTNNKLIRFEQELKRSGMTAAQQTVALEKYKKALLEIQQAGGNRQVDYLSRALGPQITDVFVGLATGQSPLMVLLQQGGQLRDQFALAGVAGAEMGNMLTTAAKSMVTSVKDIAMAVGQLMVNAIKGAGMAILDFFVAPFKLAKAAMIDFIYNGNAFEAQLVRLQAAAAGFARTAAVLTSILGGALLIALFQISTAQDDFVRALYQSGASLDMNKEKAQQFALSMEGMGVSSTKAMQALTEIAKAGGFTQESLQGIITSAVNMEKYAGVAIEKTVENYKKLQDKPSEALIELAKNTGYLTAEQLKQIKSFEDVGDKVTAATMAMKTFSDIQSQIAANIQANLSPLERAFIDMKAAVVGVWHEFKTWASESELLENVLGGLGLTVKVLALGFKVLKAIMSGATWPELRDSLTKDAESIRDYLDVSKKGVNGLDAATREYNANAVKGYQNQLKLAAELKGKLDPQQMGKDAFVAAKMRELLASTGGSFATDLNALKLMKDATAKFTKEWQDGQAKVTSGTNATKKEVDETLKYQLRIQESVRDLVIETGNLGKQETEITKATKLRADLIDDPLWNQQTEQAKINLLAALDILDADERRLKWNEAIRKIQLESLDSYFQYKEKVAEAHSDTLKSLMDEKRTLTESADVLAFQWSLMGKTEEEAKLLTREYERQSKLKKAEYEYWKSISELNDNQALSDEQRRAQKFLLDKNYAEQQRQINSETAKLYADDTLKEFNRIRDSLSDAIVTALFEGGQAGKKKLRDLLVAELKKPITLYINAMVTTFMQDVLGMGKGSGSTAGGFGNKLGSGFSTSGIGSAITSVGNFTGIPGLSNFGTGFGLGSSGVNAMSVMGEAISPMMNLGGLVADAIPYIGWAMLGIDLVKKFKSPGEQHTGAMVSTRGSELDMATAMSITGGREGASRDLTKRFNADLAKGIKPLVEGVLSGTNSALAAIGLGGYTIDAGFAANTNGKGKNKNAFGYFNLYDAAGTLVKEYVNRELGTDLEEALTKFGGDIEEAVSSIALSGTDLRKEGETNAAALKRVSEALLGTNKWLDVLNHNLFETSIKGAEAAGALSELFGGTANMESALASYYDKFYSEEEKTTNIIRKLTTEFEKLGEPIPANIKEFKKLVAAQDLNTEAGRKTYATLIGLSDAFYEVNQEADGVKTTVESALDDAFSALESAVKREQDMISKRISAIESTRNALSKLFDLLSNATRELYGSVSSTKSGMVSSARQFITNAVATAQSGGGLPDADKLGEAIGTVRTGISDTLYSTRFEQERDTLMLAGELSVLQGFADEQLSSAELQLKELKDQSEQMDLMLESYKVQIDLAKNLDVSVLSVADAIRQMEQTLADILDPTGAKRGKPQATVSGGSGGGGGYGSDAGVWNSGYYAPSGLGPTTDSYSMSHSRFDIYGGLLTSAAENRTPYEQAQIYLNATSGLDRGLGGADQVAAAMIAAGASQEQVEQVQAAANAYQQYQNTYGGTPSSGSAFVDYFNDTNPELAKDNPYAWMNLPSYDVGTNYVPRDMVAQLHEGEAVVPKRYNPAANGDSEDSAAATDLAGLRVELQAIALNTDKTRRLLERVTMDGNSLLVTDTATL